jgi:ribonuclease HI
MRVPGKVKIFVWRALHGIIPIKCVLANRHIGNSGACPICDQGAEDVRHLLFTCPAAVQVWQNLGIHHIILDALQVDLAGSAVLEYLMNRQDNTMRGFSDVGLKEIISVTSWYLWWIRRQRTRNEPVPPVNKCKMSILAITANAAKAYGQRVNSTSVKWCKPEPRQVKLNVDASFYVDSASGATGAVLRDFHGDFIAASTTYLRHVASPMMAEAIAMREGLSLANRIGCSNVIAESDSTEVIQACTGEQSWWNESAAIFADCVDLASNLETISFKYCRREANEVAHELARFCFINTSSYIWDGDPPSFLLDKLVNDVTEL